MAGGIEVLGMPPGDTAASSGPVACRTSNSASSRVTVLFARSWFTGGAHVAAVGDLSRVTPPTMTRHPEAVASRTGTPGRCTCLDAMTRLRPHGRRTLASWGITWEAHSADYNGLRSDLTPRLCSTTSDYPRRAWAQPHCRAGACSLHSGQRCSRRCRRLRRRSSRHWSTVSASRHWPTRSVTALCCPMATSTPCSCAAAEAGLSH
jgi:hypothetical protein